MDDNIIKIPDSEKTLTAGKLFYNWFAANIGIMGFVFGAMIVSYHLSFFQAIIASLVGALSFAIPGWVAMIGQKEGVTTFKLSRAAYGTHGNKIPNAIAWLTWLAGLPLMSLREHCCWYHYSVLSMLKSLQLPQRSPW